DVGEDPGTGPAVEGGVVQVDVLATGEHHHQRRGGASELIHAPGVQRVGAVAGELVAQGRLGAQDLAGRDDHVGASAGEVEREAIVGAPRGGLVDLEHHEL